MNQQSTIDLNSLWHVVTSNLSVLSATRRWRSLLLRLPCMLSGIQIAGAPGFSKSFKAAYRTPVELLENVWTCWTLSANILLILGLLNMFIRDHQSMQLRWFLGRPSFVACRQPKHRPVGHQEIHCPNTMNMRQFFFVFFFFSRNVYGSKVTPNWSKLGVHPVKSSDFLGRWSMVPISIISSSEYSSGRSGQQRLGTTQAWPKGRLLKP